MPIRQFSQVGNSFDREPNEFFLGAMVPATGGILVQFIYVLNSHDYPFSEDYDIYRNLQGGNLIQIYSEVEKFSDDRFDCRHQLHYRL